MPKKKKILTPEEIEKGLTKTSFLLETIKSLASCKNLDDALEKLVNITSDHLNAERSTIFLNEFI